MLDFQRVILFTETMQEIFLNLPEVRLLVEKTFPEYKGKKFSVMPRSGRMDLSSFWNSGSKSYHALINLNTGIVQKIPENGGPFQRGKIEMEIPANIAVVTWQLGAYEHVVISIHPDNLNRFVLPAPDQLTREEKIVLSATRSLKSSYAGVSNYRFREANQITGISLESWNTAKENLIKNGFLNKAGAITDKGRNAIGWTNLRDI